MTDNTLTISPARSGSVGSAVACLPLCGAIRASSLARPPYLFPRPEIEEPTAGEFVATNCAPWRVLETTETPSILWTGLETHTWGEWLEHWIMVVTLVPTAVTMPAVGDALRLIVDYTDDDNYIAAEYVVVEHPDAETEALWHRLRLLERVDGVETQLSRECYKIITEAYTAIMLQVRLDPPIGDVGDAVLSVTLTEPANFVYGLWTGAPVTVSGSRRVGLAVPAGSPRLRTVTVPTIEPRVTLTTRTSDTAGVWTFPAGSRLPSYDELSEYYPWRWAAGDSETLSELTTASERGKTTYSVVIDEDGIDVEARTLTGTLKTTFPAQPALPPVDTVGSGDYVAQATPHSTPGSTHDLIFPARVDLAVSDWPLFAGDWGLLHNWAMLSAWPRSPAGYCFADCDHFTWSGWLASSAPDDTRALTWDVADCPAVWGVLTTRTSDTAGIVTFPHAGHEIREGDTVSAGTGSSANLTAATVTDVTGAIVTFSGGTGTLAAVNNDTWLRVTTDADDRSGVVTANVLNPDTLHLYGEHVTTTTALTLARRLDPLDWRIGPLREDGPTDDLSFDRESIRTPYRLQFSWAAATDDPITVLARTFPDPTTGEWTATLQFPDRADGWTVPDDTFGARFGIYGAFTGSVTAYDDATNQITWEGSSNPWNLFATLSTRTSATVGILTTSAIYHLVDTGAPITLSWASGTASTAATVTSRTDAAFTFEADGAGDALPTEGTTIYVTGRNALPPPEGAYDDATGTTTWYARTYRHFDADFSLASELVDLIALE